MTAYWSIILKHPVGKHFWQDTDKTYLFMMCPNRHIPDFVNICNRFFFVKYLSYQVQFTPLQGTDLSLTMYYGRPTRTNRITYGWTNQNADMRVHREITQRKTDARLKKAVAKYFWDEGTISQKCRKISI